MHYMPLTLSSIEVIERDLPRTLPSLGFFDRPESVAYEELRLVLECTALQLPRVSYVQGMSYIAALVLLFLKPPVAFVCFANMMHAPFFRSLTHMDPAHVRRTPVAALALAHDADGAALATLPAVVCPPRTAAACAPQGFGCGLRALHPRVVAHALC